MTLLAAADETCETTARLAQKAYPDGDDMFVAVGNRIPLCRLTPEVRYGRDGMLL